MSDLFEDQKGSESGWNRMNEGESGMPWVERGASELNKWRRY